MSDTPSKIDSAAERAFAEAAEKKATATVNPRAVARAVEADATAPVEAAAISEAVAAEPAKPAAPAKAPAPVGKAPARDASAKRTALKKTTAKKTKKAAPRAANRSTPISKLKDTIMATAADTATTDYTAKARELAADVQTRAKAAYEKGTEMTKDSVEFQKGNFEALVESGKILAAGMQDMGRAYVEDAKGAVETVQADVRKIAAIKTPNELFQLQGEIARRNFDAAVASASKNTEAFLKLFNEAFAPVSNRMSVAVEKVSKVA